MKKAVRKGNKKTTATTSRRKIAKQGNDLLREIGTMVVKEWTKQSAPIIPKDFEIVAIFDAEFPREFNGLYCHEKTGRLFMCNANFADKIQVRGGCVPLEETQLSDFKEVNLKQALEWYVRCTPFASGSTHNIEILCAMAAKKLKE